MNGGSVTTVTTRPRIGITSWPRDVEYEGVPERCDTFSHDYVSSVIAAGGLPILLPLGDDYQFLCGHGPGSSIGQERVANPFLR